MESNRNRQALKEFRFDNARLGRLGIEVFSMANMRRFGEAHRVDFYMLVLVARGKGTHMVDFVDHELAPGSLVFLRPGQVQQWRLAPDVDGEIVLVAPDALYPGGTERHGRREQLLALSDWPAFCQLCGADRDALEAACMRLRHEFERFDETALSIELIRETLQCLMLRLAQVHADARHVDRSEHDAAAGVYRRFLGAIEQGFAFSRNVATYARRLGYSESALYRACLHASSRSPKQLLDRRVALEAQRLLVHSDVGIAEIGHGLGFSEATNFVKFFRRHTRSTPDAFRRSYRDGAPPPSLTGR